MPLAPPPPYYTNGSILGPPPSLFCNDASANHLANMFLFEMEKKMYIILPVHYKVAPHEKKKASTDSRGKRFFLCR